MSTYLIVPGRRGGPISDAYRVPQQRTRPLGDAADRYAAAWVDAWNSSHWTYGKPVTSIAAAIVAARWAYLEAAKESDSHEGYFNDLALKTPYTYQAAGLSMSSIMRTVANETSKHAPLVSRKVSAMVAAPRSAPAKKTAPRRARSEVVTLPPDEPVRESLTAQLPTWWPLAAGAAAVAAAWFLIPQRRAS